MVLLPAHLLAGLAPPFCGPLDQRHATAGLFGQIGGDADILGQKRQRKAGGKFAGQDLGLDRALGGEVSARRDVHHVERNGGIEAEALAHDQRFGSCRETGGGDIIVERLQRMARADAASLEHFLAHRHQNGSCAFERGLVVVHDGQGEVGMVCRIARSGFVHRGAVEVRVPSPDGDLTGGSRGHAEHGHAGEGDGERALEARRKAGH